MLEHSFLVNQAAPNFIEGMNPELTACLDEMKKIDYTPRGLGSRRGCSGLLSRDATGRYPRPF